MRGFYRSQGLTPSLFPDSCVWTLLPSKISITLPWLWSWSPFSFLNAIESSRVGMTFLSVQQSEPLSESIGVNTSGFRVLAFSIGGFFAGLAGAFYSHYVSAIAPGSFGFLLAIYIFIYMVVGGTQKSSGPIVGAIFLTLVPELSRWAKEYEPFIFAVILLLVIFFLRGGLASLPERVGELLRREV